MPVQRTLTIILAAALFGSVVAAAQAQNAPASRGSVKVRPRFFNPFDVGASQITLNPFGVFNFVQPTFGAPAAASAASASADTEESTAVATGISVRPSFRPPVRSPFRPPPRPPF